MTYRRFVASQSIIMMAGNMVFPFYILLLRNVGDGSSSNLAGRTAYLP